MPCESAPCMARMTKPLATVTEGVKPTKPVECEPWRDTEGTDPPAEISPTWYQMVEAPDAAWWTSTMVEEVWSRATAGLKPVS